MYLVKIQLYFIKVILCAILFGLVSKVFAEFTHFLKKVFSDKIQNTCVKSFIGGIIIIILILLIGNRMYLGLSLELLAKSFESVCYTICIYNKATININYTCYGISGR